MGTTPFTMYMDCFENLDITWSFSLPTMLGFSARKCFERSMLILKTTSHVNKKNHLCEVVFWINIELINKCFKPTMSTPSNEG